MLITFIAIIILNKHKKLLKDEMCEGWDHSDIFFADITQ